MTPSLDVFAEYAKELRNLVPSFGLNLFHFQMQQFVVIVRSPFLEFVVDGGSVVIEAFQINA